MTTVAQGSWEGLTIAGGRYQLLKTINSGAMADVYRAFDSRLRTDVVIKAPRGAGSKTAPEMHRFETEITALVKLAHPHIVPVIDLGRHAGLPYVVMRYMSGGSLHDRLVQGRGNPPQSRSLASLATWLPSIAKALDFVHAQGILHLDVKPANILFDQHGHAFLSDFGIIKLLGAQPPSNAKLPPRPLMGTAEYMSPELLQGQEVNGLADQYSLAATIFETLAGRPPFNAQSVEKLVTLHLHEPVPSLSKIAPQVPPTVAVVVERGLAKHPQQRYPNCLALTSALVQAVTAARPMASSASVSSTGMSSRGSEPAGHAPSAQTQILATVTTGTQETPAPFHGSVEKSRPTNTSPRRASAVGMFAGVAGIVCLLGTGGWWLANQADRDVRVASRASPAIGSVIDAWNNEALTLERAVAADSRPLLAHPKYASAEEFVEQVAKVAPPPERSILDRVEQLDHQLEEIAHQRQLAGPAGVAGQAAGSREDRDSNALHDQQRELAEQDVQIATMRRRLHQLQQATSPESRGLDATAVAELTTLRQIEAAVNAPLRPSLSDETQRRAAELADLLDNDALAWKALLAILRAGHPAATERAVNRLAQLSDERKFEVGLSLLIAGRTAGLRAAQLIFDSQVGLQRRLPMNDLLAIVEAHPKDYESILSAIAHWCSTSETWLRVRRLQLPQLSAVVAREIEDDCRSGVLATSVDQVVTALLYVDSPACHALLEKLLANHPTTKLPLLTEEQLRQLFNSAPATGRMFVENFILQGAPNQRTTALNVYREWSSSAPDERLRRRLQDGPVAEPAVLLNQLLTEKEPHLLRLAEALLRGQTALSPHDLKFDEATAEVLSREELRTPLIILAAGGDPAQRTWALEQHLGSDLVAKLRKADALSNHQLEECTAVTAILDGNLVSLPGPSSTKSADKGLVVTLEEFPRLPRKIDPLRWGPDGDAAVTLSRLQTGLAALPSHKLASLQSAVDDINRYVEKITALLPVAQRLTTVYNQTILLQLPGAQRNLMAKPASNWHFRFISSLLEQYRLDRMQFTSISRAVREERTAVRALLQLPAAQ